jgi:outer membrane protein assembly factor BamB
MYKFRKIAQISAVICLILLAVTMTGCSIRTKNIPQGSPVEPIIPGEDKGDAQTLQGRFAVKPDVQILDLSATEDGALAAVGSASRTVYLLGRDGKLRWEKPFNTLPLQTYLEPAGRFLAVGTAGGRVHLLNPDQTTRFELNLGHPIGLLRVAANGELLLVGLYPEDPQAVDRVVVLDKYGRVLTEMAVGELQSAAISGPDNRIIVSWQDDQGQYLGAFTADGEQIWKKEDRSLLAVSGNGHRLATSRGQEIFVYNNDGREQWTDTAAGVVRKLILSQNGSYLGALVKDEASHIEELLYLNMEGERLWSKRLPDDSEVLVSSDGRKVVIASWRQYREDATQVLVYNQRGQEINTLEVAGRVQRMVLQADILVLGLEDGSIYFLNIAQPTSSNGQVAPAQDAEQDMESYYRPLDFSRGKDETLLTLFFYDENAMALIPVTRRTKWTQTALRASIDELIRGPVQGSQLQRTIPKDAEIDVVLNEGVAVVDLPPALDVMGGTTFLTGVLNSLLLTVSQFPTVEEVQFTVGGQQQETFGQEGLLIDEPFAPRRLSGSESEQLIFLPHRSGSRYYLLPFAYEFLPLKEKALAEGVVLQIMNEAWEYFPHGLRLKSVQFEGTTAYVDFSKEFELLIKGTDPESAARAALIRDAIALSISKNLPYTTVRFMVESQPLAEPKGYLPWELTVSRPYYLNREE